MRKIVILLVTLWGLTSLKLSGQWYLHHTVLIQTARAIDQAPDNALWVARSSGVSRVTLDGVITNTFGTISNTFGIAYNASDNRMWATIAGGATRLRGWDADPPHTLTQLTGVSGARHLQYLSDGGAILAVNGTGSNNYWARINAAGAVVMQSPNLFGTPIGVAVDEGGDRFWISDVNKDSVYQFTLSTGVFINRTLENNVTGLFYDGSTLLCTTEDGVVKVVGGSILLSGLDTAQDVIIGGDFLAVVESQAVKIYRSFPVLPITLSSFEVEASGKDGAKAIAVTESEVNNSQMILEQSRDGVKFEEVSRLVGAGNSSTKKVYTFKVNGLVNGTHYFRLRQVDFDGTSTTSTIRALYVEGDETFNVFPNPAESWGKITVILPKGADVVNVYNIKGELIREVRNGETSLPIGNYVFYVAENGVSRFVVVR